MPADLFSQPIYPKRPRFFAHRFCRILLKMCAANEIGPEACWLLTIIAHTEDAKGYRDAVSFFNGQLMPLVGFKSEDTLDRCRKRAIAAGWLTYIPGTKSVAGKYWVTIPERFEDLDDAPSDESEQDIQALNGSTCDTNTNVPSETFPLKNRVNVRNICGTSAEDVRKMCGPLFPVPIPIPIQEREREKTGHSSEDQSLDLQLTPLEQEEAAHKFWSCYPRKSNERQTKVEFSSIIITRRNWLDLMAGLEAWASSDEWRRDGGRWIPYPANFLRSEKWRDRPIDPATIPPPPTAPKSKRDETIEERVARIAASQKTTNGGSQ